MNEHADKMKVKDQLNQLHGNLEQLLYNEIDSTLVHELQSGQKKAKEAKKQLTKEVTNLLNKIEDTVNQLSKQ